MIIQTGPTIRVNLVPTSKPESASNDKKPNPNTKTHYGEYVIWLAITAGFAVVIFWSVARDYLDKHNGSVSAFATLAIMLLTIAYVRYARHQWKVMDKQAEIAAQQATIAEAALRVQEASQRQWVDLQDWQIWLDKGKEDSAIRIRFKIANPTNIPLALDHVSTTSKITGGIEKIQQSAMDDVLAPRNPSIYDVTIPLTHEQTEKVKNFTTDDVIIMVIIGSVVFTDASKTRWEQTFERYIWCSKSKFLEQTEPITASVRQTANGLKQIPT